MRRACGCYGSVGTAQKATHCQASYEACARLRLEVERARIAQPQTAAHSQRFARFVPWEPVWAEP